MKAILLSIFLIFHLSILAQCTNVCGANLIANPGFETSTANCVPGDIQIYENQTPVANWFGTEPLVANQAAGSTPDYFSPCAGSTNSANNVCINGNSRIGLFTKASFSNGREYVQAQLLNQLEAGKTYCFTMTVKSRVGAAGNLLSSCDGIGAWFHGMGLINIETMNGGNQFLGSGSTINASPQVENPSGNMIGASCVNVTGTFCATGNENWVVLGNFRDDATTMMSGSNPSNYMYIDDVQLFEICPPELEIGASPQSINCGESTTLTVNSTFPVGTNYTWISPVGNSLSGTGPFVLSPATTTTYTLVAEFTNACGVQNDTSSVVVNVTPCGVNAVIYDTIICEGSCHDLYAYSPNGGQAPYSFLWVDASGDTIGLNQGPVQVCPTTDTYYILNVTDVNGDSFTDTLDLQVLSYPAVFAGQDTAICNGTDIELIGTSDNGMGQWQGQGVLGSSYLVSPIASTVYIFEANNGGCYSSDSVLVEVNELPQATANSSSVSCSGMSNGSVWVSPMNTYTCHWQPINVVADSVTGLGAGWYTVSISDSIGCTITDSIEVASPDTLEFTVNGNTTVCFGESTTLSVLVEGGTPDYTISWNNGQAIGYEFTLLPQNTTTVDLVVTDYLNCIASQTINITVNPRPIADFIGGIKMCAKTDTVLINTSTGAANFQWLVNGANASNSEDLLFDWNAPGCYEIGLIATNTFGCSDTMVQACAVEIQPVPDADISVSSSVLTIDDPNVTFYQSSQNSDNCYWYLNGVMFHNGCEGSFSYEFAELGTYNILLETTNEFGCTNMDSLKIVVREGLIFYVPNTFTPDGDEHNNTFAPVFTSGFDPQNFQLIIYDRWGEILFESYDYQQSWDGTYHDQLCKEGVYTWVITFKDLYTDENYIKSGHLSLIK